MKCMVTGERHEVVHTHHIKTRGSGGTDDPLNLVTVCPVHHDQIHRGYLVLDSCQTARHRAGNVVEGAAAVRAYLFRAARERDEKPAHLRKLLEPHYGTTFQEDGG